MYSFMDYVLCIDGGGSKTSLQVVNAQGNVLPLTKKDITSDTIVVSGSNIHNVGIDGVRLALRSLMDDIIIEHDKTIRDILSQCYVVAGMAAAEEENNKKIIIQLFEELGINKNNIMLMSDSALALGLVPGDGAILIAGTGSICLGKKGDERYRVGGLGYLLGDEGSGYAMGLKALKLALAYEYGWGKPTTLTAQLCTLYNVSQLKEVMQTIYGDTTIAVQTISRAAPIVVEQAFIKKDDQAVAIINDMANQLSVLVATMANMSDLSDAEVHLWGGLFKSAAANIFIAVIQQHPIIRQRRIKLVNQAWQNATTLFAKQLLARKRQVCE